jgi:hypothetical protein
VQIHVQGFEVGQGGFERSEYTAPAVSGHLVI